MRRSCVEASYNLEAMQHSSGKVLLLQWTGGLSLVE